MAEEAKAQVYRGGFFEAWLRRCGERPGRAFARTFGVLLVLWLLAGMMGLRHSKLSPVPPSVHGIPYGRYIAQHTKGYGIAMNREEVPRFDSSAARSDLRFDLKQNSQHGQPSLTAVQTVGEFGYGWPFQLCFSETQRRWNVTEPIEPFSPVIAEPSNLKVDDRLLLIISSREVIGQTRWSYVYWPRILIELLALELAVVALVLAGKTVFRLRQRLRCRGGCCLSCGYPLTPNPDATACSECGAHIIPLVARRLDGYLRNWLHRRPVTTVLFVWLAMGVAVVGLSALCKSSEPTDNLKTQAEWYLQEQPNAAVLSPGELRGFQFVPYRCSSAWYGWPLRFVNVIDHQTLVFRRGSTEHAALSTPKPEPLRWLYFDYEVSWERILPSDATMIRRYELHWQRALLLLCGLQVVAIATVVVGRLTCRK